MRVQVVSNHSVVHPWKYWSGCGGSEAALHQITRHLAKRGHEVIVSAPLGGRDEGVFEGVSYTAPLGLRSSCDILIYFRESFPLPFPVQASRRVWFTTDAYLAGDNWPATLWPYVDSGVCISRFHLSDLERRYHHLPPMTVIPLGCDPDEMQNVSKVHNRLIYCSEPARGLEHLLGAWPRIRQAIPDATLSVTFDYRLWNNDARVERFRHLAQQPGIDYLGMIPRRDLLRAQAEAELHVYPCTFEENFCLASLECQLQGTPTVATRIGALPETVLHGSGFLTDLHHVPETVIYLLRHREVLETHQQAARESALRRTWADTAAAWDAFLS